jgi:hypothetical protein
MFGMLWRGSRGSRARARGVNRLVPRGGNEAGVLAMVREKYYQHAHLQTSRVEVSLTFFIGRGNCGLQGQSFARVLSCRLKGQPRHAFFGCRRAIVVDIAWGYIREHGEQLMAKTHRLFVSVSGLLAP